MDSRLVDVIRAAIGGAPLAQLLGIVCESIEADVVRLRLPFRPEVTTIGDLVHGGALSALIDAAATAAAWTGADLEASPRGTTVALTVNFLRGARGQDVVAQARVTQRGRSIVGLDVEARDAGGEIVARALVTYKLDHRT